MALALLALGADDCALGRGDLARPVAAVVVVDVDVGVGQRLAEPGDGRADRRSSLKQGSRTAMRGCFLVGTHTPVMAPRAGLFAFLAAAFLAGRLGGGLSQPWQPAFAGLAGALAPAPALTGFGFRRLSWSACRPLAGLGLPPAPSLTGSAGSGAASAFGSLALLRLGRPLGLARDRLGSRFAMVVAAAGAVDMAFLALEVGLELLAVRRNARSPRRSRRGNRRPCPRYSGARSCAANIGPAGPCAGNSRGPCPGTARHGARRSGSFPAR